MCPARSVDLELVTSAIGVRVERSRQKKLAYKLVKRRKRETCKNCVAKVRRSRHIRTKGT